MTFEFISTYLIRFHPYVQALSRHRPLRIHTTARPADSGQPPDAILPTPSARPPRFVARGTNSVLGPRVQNGVAAPGHLLVALPSHGPRPAPGVPWLGRQSSQGSSLYSSGLKRISIFSFN
jgi:hypothetical protein